VIYRAIVTPAGSEPFMTAEMDQATFARLVRYFLWCGSRVLLYRSWDREVWRRFEFPFTAALPTSKGSEK